RHTRSKRDWSSDVCSSDLTELADLPEMNRRIDTAVIAAGRDPREIRRVLNLPGRFQDRDSGLLVGPPGQWVEQLLPLALEHGIGTLVLAADDAATIERYAAEVAPALRSAVADERSGRGQATRA